jgi:enterochelin esterase-like enzyme
MSCSRGRPETPGRKSLSEQAHPLRVPLSHSLTLLSIALGLMAFPSVQQAASLFPPGESFTGFLRRLESVSHSEEQDHMIAGYVAWLGSHGAPIVEDSTAYFIYYGDAGVVTIPSDRNGWNPHADTMTRVGQTKLFYRRMNADPASRWEYKLCVDSLWILDPLNPLYSGGGFGANSEIRMPQYAPPGETEYRSDVPHGTLDTLLVTSEILGRIYPVSVYLPPGFGSPDRRYPSVYMLDGPDYIEFGRFVNVLDNMIGDKRIVPVVGVFINSRALLNDSTADMRMTDYSMSDSFVTFLTSELRPLVLRRYHLKEQPDETAIMGISLGGLMATYTALLRPGTFGLCAAQSPSYQWNNGTIIDLVAQTPRKPVKIYLDSGTIHDASTDTRKMRDVLRAKGYLYRYMEYPEGHNWYNWRSRFDDILRYFWGTDQ